MRKLPKKDMYVVNWTPFAIKRKNKTFTHEETEDLISMPPLTTIMTGMFDDKGKRPCVKLQKYTRKGIEVKTWSEYQVSSIAFL